MKLIKFELYENTAKSTLGNTEGMGNVKSPQPVAKGETVSELPSKKRIPEPKEEQPTEKTNESVMSFNDFHLNEDGGVATATLGNTGGMGAVVAPTIGGDGATGANFNYNGDGNPTDTGTKGSGDLPAYDMGKKFDTNPFKKKSKKKKSKKSTKESRHVGTDTTKEEMYVTSWTDWMKSDVTNERQDWEDDIRKDIQDVRDFIVECNDEMYSYDSNKYQTAITKCNRIEQYFADNKIKKI